MISIWIIPYEAFERRHAQGWVWVQVNGIQINHNNTNSEQLLPNKSLGSKTYIFKYFSNRLIWAWCVNNNPRSLKFVVKMECLGIPGSFMFLYDSLLRSSSVCAGRYRVKQIVEAGTCSDWLQGSRAEASAHMRETYFCICFYEANKKPPLSLAQLPPCLIYVREFTPHCSTGEAGRWPGCTERAKPASAVVRENCLVQEQLCMMNFWEVKSQGRSIQPLQRLGWCVNSVLRSVWIRITKQMLWTCFILCLA